MRRFLALFLSIVLLVSFVPFSAEGVGFVKDIDALFGDFQLKINGKKVANHKESFLYQEELFVALDDLARGLDMGVSIQNNNIYINSKGKLSFNADTSLEALIFQRGYETSAKERIITSLQKEIDVLNGKTPSGVDYKLKSNIKNIKVGFGKMIVYLDGNKIKLDTFVYGNDIYVDLDAIAPYLYITPTLSKDKTTINVDANGVLIKDSYYSTLGNFLSAREGKNYLLDLQLAELEKKKSLLEEYKLPYQKITSIDSLEKYLNKHFSKIGQIDVNFDVVQQSNRINLDISFPVAKNSLWTKLGRSDVEQWIWNIYTAILKLYNEDAIISGVVRNPSYSYSSTSHLRNYVTFYSKDKDIYFDFSNSKLVVDKRIDVDYLLELLNKNLPKYQNTSLSYDGNISENTLELVIYPSTDSFNKLSLFSKMGYLKQLNQRIKDVYPDLIVKGSIVYFSSDIPSMDFYIEENRISSAKLLAETEKYINNNFGYFSHGNNRFKATFSIYEKDMKNFHLNIETDFSVNDSKWKNTGEAGHQRLNANIHSAVSYILSLWDANVSTTVADKDGTMIMDFDAYQETVSIVYADPPSGEVVEGTKVSLSTDTPGAGIYYTLDGSTPTTSSNLYDGNGIMINESLEINAMGYKDGLGTGPVSTFRYTIVKDSNLSYGLTDLRVNPGTLDKAFVHTTTSYSVHVDSNTSTIDITPFASNGVITVNGNTVISGESINVTLNSNSTTIRISVKEADKNERVYTVVVNKSGGESPSGFRVADLRFNTLFGLIFNGRLTHGTIKDFDGYSVELYTRSNVHVETVGVSENGEFSFPNISINPIDKIIGFKYRVLNGFGETIIRDTNLN